MKTAYDEKRDAKLQERLDKELVALSKQGSNAACADCAATRTVRFVSVTLGTFICNRCYGIHRSIGAHITRGKCLGLDAWTKAEISFLRSMGNERAAGIYEANVPSSTKRPTENSTDKEVELWIRDKYERKRYIRQEPTVPTSAGDQLESMLPPSQELAKISISLPQRAEEPHRLRPSKEGLSLPVSSVCTNAVAVPTLNSKESSRIAAESFEEAFWSSAPPAADAFWTAPVQTPADDPSWTASFDSGFGAFEHHTPTDVFASSGVPSTHPAAFLQAPLPFSSPAANPTHTPPPGYASAPESIVPPATKPPKSGFDELVEVSFGNFSNRPKVDPPIEPPPSSKGPTLAALKSMCTNQNHQPNNMGLHPSQSHQMQAMQWSQVPPNMGTWW